MDYQAWFAFVRDIAADLSHGRVIFPTSFETTMKLRELMRSEVAGADQIVIAVTADPLLSAKVLQLANSALYARDRQATSDIRAAVLRLGINQVRNLAAALAMSQLVTYRQMVPYKNICDAMLRHSRGVAAVAAILAREHSSVEVGKAFFAGLVHDIGVFYLIYRLSDRTEFFKDMNELHTLLHEWHGQIGHAVLATLDVSQEIRDAIAEHDHPRPVRNVLALADLLYVANAIVQQSEETRTPIVGEGGRLAEQIEQFEDYLATIEASRAEVSQFTQAFP